MSAPSLPFDTALVVPPDVDVRGFVHSLAAARTKLTWQLDQRQAELGRVLAELRRLQKRLEALADQARQCAAELVAATARRLDPHAHRQVLAFLAHLRQQQAEVQQELQQQAEQRQQLQVACIALQLRLEGMNNHRQDELNQFVEVVRRREANERDREWLARRQSSTNALEEGLRP